MTRAVNDKQIRRLWRDERRRVPSCKRKAPLRRVGAHAGAMCPIPPEALRQLDTTADGRN